ncbi:hypothetical protein PVAP13_9KG386600 [Panicum virgatum]|uniref:Uncharacterized protein n=1 Tax=Panicum virgatum TaxID=38727 RepID=A0A8T0NSM1_PANVG|nr:hypothetical protein PVAP13_9KG386600 [Panicum virgatum]KAG2551259.1 hypothetical protein PVAP13_9KG386600 [Panicum virgatum]KAG2551260.1 hypothetical protein PVAP13_9KG386600 [Panicum virgatum]KAG2551261.1 hypothetical protein PVAP13_9KG386600 [Panicum virgatum]KAG2551264.1 hypothetical protein PVAP13_9KG386600 [Panicum virgatum]
MMLGLQHQQHRASSRSALRRGTRVVARRGRRRPGMYMQHGRAPLKGSTRSASRCVPGRRGERRRSRRGRTTTSSVPAPAARARPARRTRAGQGHVTPALAPSTCSTDCLAAPAWPPCRLCGASRGDKDRARVRWRQAGVARPGCQGGGRSSTGWRVGVHSVRPTCTALEFLRGNDLSFYRL